MDPYVEMLRDVAEAHDRAMVAARKAAVDEFPEAAPFVDLIRGDSPDDIRAVAQNIAERARADIAAKQAAAAADAAEGVEKVDERVAEAVAKRSMSDFLKAKREGNGGTWGRQAQGSGWGDGREDRPVATNT